ncbi:MAG: AAA family ATPase, partial [bacterium]
RHGLQQLVRGVSALHDAGHLHRDIKPSNVLVEAATRRIVLLDFGLVTPLEGPRLEREHGFSGTLEYMAPEQADGDAPNAASDWYAVGVVLFEALTGQLPFRGKPFKIMIDKRRKDAPAPSTLAPDIPDDLDHLCRALLRRDPQSRPDAETILGAAGVERRNTGAFALTGLAHRGRLIGREAQMAALEDALAAARAGRPVLVGVHGGSGMGKSALLRRFLDPLVEHPDLMVLSGRCYERESVPYKAFDAIIDALTRRLGLMPDDVVEELLPGPLRPLTRLFPVMLHVDAIAVRSLPEDEPSDPRELRQRGFALLRRLFVGLARKMTPVIHIDDLQWGDLDSAALLTELLRGDDAPPMLVIGSYRTEEIDSSAFLRATIDLVRDHREALGWREIVVGPLDESGAARLARARLGARRDIEDLSRLIARESRGNPFFVEALARHLQQSRPAAPDGERSARPSDPIVGLTVDAVVRSRVDMLDEPARRLMHALAVFGRPLDARVALDAAAVTGDVSARIVGVLRAEHLLRVRAA